MVICRYFLQGCCRYGTNCRFEHTYSSKYSYQASTAANSNIVSDEDLVKQVQSDIQAALQGGQWILSCYAPFKEKACFPGLTDMSPEEARLIIYEARANNTLNEAVAYMTNLFKENRNKYEQLLRPSGGLIKILRSLYNGEPVSSPFGSTAQGFGTQASSLFRSAVQNDPFKSASAGQTNSVFSRLGNQNTNSVQNAPKSIFAQANQNVFGPSQPSNIFQSQPQANMAAKSIFAQASQNIFGPQTATNQQTQPNNIFAQPQNVFATNTQQNAFATPQQNTNTQQNAFATPQQNNAFGIFNSNQQQSNPFGISQQNQTGNVFQQNSQISQTNADIFGISKNVISNVQPDDTNIYSKIEDLSPEDLEAFKSEEFKLGFVPELPPPHSLCV